MHWNPEKDMLQFGVKLNFSLKVRKMHIAPNIELTEISNNLPSTMTKRQILSQVNGVFDPVGLLSPFIVRAKIMMRRLWAENNTKPRDT